MKVANKTAPVSQVHDEYKLVVKLSDREARALIRARRDLRKATIENDLRDRYDVDVVNGIIMLAGRVLEDAGRDVSSVDFDERHS